MALARTLGVVGASGGVGTSTLAACLATRFTDRGAAACVDADPLGGGVDVVFGLDHAAGLGWRDLVAGGEHRPGPTGAALVDRLPRVGDVAVLSFPRAAVATPSGEAWDLVFESLRPRVDLVVVDLPPPGDPELPALLPRLDDVVLLVGGTPTALAAASTVHAALDDHVDRWWLAQAVPRGGDDLAEAVASALDMPLLLAWPHDPRVATDLAHGSPPGRRGRAAAAAGQGIDRLYGRPRGRRTRGGPRELVGRASAPAAVRRGRSA